MSLRPSIQRDRWIALSLGLDIACGPCNLLFAVLRFDRVAGGFEQRPMHGFAQIRFVLDN